MTYGALFGNSALQPIYGAGVASAFAGLIREHLLIAIRLVAAAKQRDTAAAAQAEKEWYANADRIAATLASINLICRTIFFKKCSMSIWP